MKIMARPACLVLGVLCIISACCAFDSKGFYEGYQLLQVIPGDAEQVDYVYQLTQMDSELDFWHDARRPGDYADIFVTPDKLEMVKDYLRKGNLDIRIIHENMETVISKYWTNLKQEREQMKTASFDYDEFHTYEEIMAEIDVWVNRCPSGFQCETYSIGKSVEGRDMNMFRIFKEGSNRPSNWIDSTIHAREWLAPATHLKIIDHLLSNYGSETQATRFLDSGDWYFLPVHNPDGYAFTWTTGQRLWRKNRFNNTLVRDTGCMGVDLNRNYMHRWGNAGTNDNPCSATYRGMFPASEIETRNVQNEMLRLGDKLQSVVSIHTAANLILSPWGSVLDPWSQDLCEFLNEPEKTDIGNVAAAMAKAIQDTHSYGPDWEGGPSCATIYPASGITSDFARGVVGITFSFTPELRDRGELGIPYTFVPAATEIQPSFEEMWNGMVAMMDGIDEYNERYAPTQPTTTTRPPTTTQPTTDGASTITPVGTMLVAVALAVSNIL